MKTVYVYRVYGNRSPTTPHAVFKLLKDAKKFGEVYLDYPGILPWIERIPASSLELRLAKVRESLEPSEYIHPAFLIACVDKPYRSFYAAEADIELRRIYARKGLPLTRWWGKIALPTSDNSMVE
jgi:hypothetical protein